jgi:aminopeptidase N
MKGAFFLRDIERIVGKEGLYQVLRTFYQNNRGDSVGMQDLLNLIKSETGYDPEQCAALWLHSEAVPDEGACQYY